MMAILDSAEVARRFRVYPVDPNTIVLLDNVRTMLGEAAAELVAMLPDCRETSLAITHLEEAVFWANAALARPPAAVWA